MPPATSSAIASHVLVDAESRASGVPDGGARCIVGISITASQSRPSVTSSRIRAEPPGTSISPGSNLETSSSRASIAVADGSAVAVPIPSKIPPPGGDQACGGLSGRLETTVQGSIRDSTTRPAATYGSASRKASATAIASDSDSNTKRAPLGGSPVAPAIARSPSSAKRRDQIEVVVAVRLAALEHAVDVFVGEDADRCGHGDRFFHAVSRLSGRRGSFPSPSRSRTLLPRRASAGGRSKGAPRSVRRSGTEADSAYIPTSSSVPGSPVSSVISIRFGPLESGNVV